MATKQQEKIWTFDVTDPTFHPNGFTIYKVICRVFPISAPESLTEIIVWKRYNDFKQLYKAMVTLHKALHRREEFPLFAKPKLFGRFDGIVIEERRSTAMDLLNFIGRQYYLYKSTAFLNFLEGGKVIHGISGECLKPSKLSILNSENSTPATLPSSKQMIMQPQPSSQLTSIMTETTELPSIENIQDQSEAEASLDGVWNYPQIPDNISLNSFDDTDDTDEIESQLSASLPETELSLFDPLLSVDEENEKSEIQSSNSWLLAAMDTCAAIDFFSSDFCQVTVSGDHSSVKENSGDDVIQSSSEDLSRAIEAKLTDTENWGDFDPLRNHSDSKVEYGKGDLDLSFHFSGSFSSNSSASSSPRHQSGISPSHRKRRTYTGNSVSSMELGGKDGYICSAAKQICLAQECEANGKYGMAFSYYKSGVGILLQGVQSDSNKARRDAVRRKTAQYLMKAEDLYNRHLTQETLDERRWATDGLSPIADMEPSLNLLKSSLSEMRNFRVLGTIDKVILVLDKMTDETYVLKAIHKSSICSQRQQTILPTSCPYMVNLFKFYETDNAFYLLLQYASGGKLWNYIGAYLQHGTNFGKERGYNDGAEFYGMGPTCSSNVYAGVKLHDNVSEGNAKSHIDQTTRTSDAGNVPKNMDHPSICSSKNASTLQYSKFGRHRVESGKGDVDLNIWENNPVIQNKNMNNNPISVTSEKNIDFEKLEFCDRGKSNNDIQSSKNNKHYISISSEENVDIENEKTEISESAEIKESEGHFRSCLENSRQSLTLFSINSVDSSEGVPILDNYMSSNLKNQHGENENLLRIVHENNDVFVNDVLSSVTNEPITSTTRKVDIEADEIVRNAKELINSVERTLSETGSDLEHSLSRSSARNKFFLSDEFCNAQSDDAEISENSPLPVEMLSIPIKTDNSSSLSPDDEPSIYDTHKMLSSSDSSDVDNSDKTVLKSPDLDRIGDRTGEPDADKTVLARDMSKSNSSDSTAKFHTSEADASVSSTGPPQHLPLCRGNLKELSRSASCEFDLRSPMKARSRTITALFQQLDLASSGSDQVRLPETNIRQWAAEIVVALSRLHSEGIICRDLKPANILLGERGHIHLTYFCQLGQVESDLDSVAIEMMYVAPEVLSISGHTTACDWWSLGALLFELLAGKTLLSCHPGGITSHTQLVIPEHVSTEAQGLLQQLLCYSYRERLGAGLDGAEEVKAHPFFQGVDWNALER
ncbi:hypothetical protein ScPMuIL_014723 [Solemya velum]